MTKSYRRSNCKPFLALPRDMLESSAWKELSAPAVKILLAISGQYNGSNNGDLAATWGLMHERGIRSRDTLGRALGELIGAGFLQMTRQGGRSVGRGRTPTLYAITWRSIDECDRKLDVSSTKVPSNAWKKNLSTRQACHTDTVGVSQPASDQHEGTSCDTSGVSERPISRHGRRDPSNNLAIGQASSLPIPSPGERDLQSIAAGSAGGSR